MMNNKFRISKNIDMLCIFSFLAVSRPKSNASYSTTLFVVSNSSLKEKVCISLVGEKKQCRLLNHL
jgi:hypothetical protein